MSIELKSNAPTGPIETRWDRHRFEMKLVNPANRRKHNIIVVGNLSFPILVMAGFVPPSSPFISFE